MANSDRQVSIQSNNKTSKLEISWGPQPAGESEDSAGGYLACFHQDHTWVEKHPQAHSDASACYMLWFMSGRHLHPQVEGGFKLPALNMFSASSICDFNLPRTCLIHPFHGGKAGVVFSSRTKYLSRNLQANSYFPGCGNEGLVPTFVIPGYF